MVFDMVSGNQLITKPGMLSTAMYVRANCRMKAKVERLAPLDTPILASGRLKRDECRVEVLSIGIDVKSYINLTPL